MPNNTSCTLRTSYFLILNSLHLFYDEFNDMVKCVKENLFYRLLGVRSFIGSFITFKREDRFLENVCKYRPRYFCPSRTKYQITGVTEQKYAMIVFGEKFNCSMFPTAQNGLLEFVESLHNLVS